MIDTQGLQLRTNVLIPALLALMLAQGGCGKSAPAGFWLSYPAGQLVQNLEDQSSRGGWRALHRVTTGNEAFSSEALKSFAQENGWKYISQQRISPEDMRSWKTFTGKLIFPLGYDGFAPGKNDGIYDHFPRWITGNATLLTFDSGWITAIGGVTKTAYGYILVADDGKAVSIYHLWGE